MGSLLLPPPRSPEVQGQATFLILSSLCKDPNTKGAICKFPFLQPRVIDFAHSCEMMTVECPKTPSCPWSEARFLPTVPSISYSVRGVVEYDFLKGGTSYQMHCYFQLVSY